DDHAPVIGIDGKLNVRAAGLDSNFADDGDRCVAHVLVFPVCERLRWSNRDRVAGVHAHRIEVLDRADNDDVVLQVTHQLQLVFLPAEHRLFEQNLVYWRQVESARKQFEQLFAVVGDAAAGSTERERWAKDYGETDLAAEIDAVFQIIDQARLRDFESD